MGVRYRKYYPQCKPVKCNGRQGRHCPGDRPRKATGEYKACGVWCVEFFDSNKEWQSLTFKDVRNRTDAEKRLSMFITDRERGRLNLPRKKTVPTLAEYSKRYLGLYSTAKENTKAVKVRTVNTLTRLLGGYRLDKLTPFIVEKFRIERKEKDKVKDTTVNDDVVHLSHILSKAVSDGLIDKNPCKGIKKLKVESKRDRILSSEETSLLLTELQGKDRLMVLIGLLGGLRLGETLSLSWDDFDFQRGLLTFVASKTGKLVTVPLSNYLIAELQAYKANHAGDRLFESKDVDRNLVASYSEYFSKIFKKCGIHGFTYHCLRHTFASLQADLGTGAVTTKELLGHSSLDMTLRYSHTGLNSMKQAVETMTAHILNQGKKPQFALQGTA